MSYQQSTKCLLCNKPTVLVLSLGKTPLANELLETKKKPDLFPLNLVRCTDCNHLQIDTLVNEQRMYQHYLYVSDTSQSNRDYFQQYAKEMYQKFEPHFVLDIGSNDGLFLSYFMKHGCQVLGIDPAENIAKAANKKGINTWNNFFNENLSSFIKGEFGQVDLITCNNCFAHNADLHTVVKGVKNLLKPNGVFVFEVSYAMNLLANNLFDLIYHEHIHHWHLQAARKFFRQFDMEIFDVKKVPTHGGSIRIFVQHASGNKPYSIDLGRVLQEEENYFRPMVSWFPHGVQEIKEQLTKKLTEIKKAGKKVSVLGCPAKAATLASYFGLDKNVITDVFDDNKLKVDRYSPLGLKILPTSDIAKKKPDYLLILSWNYADELMKRFPNNKFIVPLPEVRVFNE